MTGVIKTCPTCGEKISSVGECLYCPPTAETEAAPAPVPEPSPAPVPVPVAAPPPEPNRAFGLVLFEAEECLARGQVEKALVHASRAVRERPGDLVARSLFERARRETLKGRRREKLEARLAEARRLYEAEDFKAAEKIVGAALKIVPDNDLALDLFARLKERRLAGPSAEAEAERELDRLARERARRSAESARALLSSGAGLRALLTVRRALRLVPDAPELLAVLAEVQGSLPAVPVPTSARAGLAAQVELARGLTARGQLDDALKTLRAVLYEDVGFVPAQAAVQDVRRAWLAARAAASPAAPPRVAPAPPVPKPAAPTPPPPAPAVARPSPAPAAKAPRAPAPAHPGGPRPVARPAAVSAGPDAVRLPARPHRTPWGLVLACGFAVGAGILYLGRSDRGPSSGGPALPPASVTLPPTAPAAPETRPEGPLAAVEPELRRAIQETLAAYVRALERVDPEALALARPDLGAEERRRLLERFEGALNVATDLRVLDVVRAGEVVTVPLLRTDVVVGGRTGSRSPVEETLRFERSGGAWALRARR